MDSQPPAHSPSGGPTVVPPQATIVIPTRNESGNVLPLLKRLHAALAGTPIEVLFVDDSSDDTVVAIQAAASAFPFPVRVIARPPERRNGLSGAVVEGFREAAGTWMCVIDADLQHPPELIPALLRRAQEAGADIVVGSRKANLLGPLGLSRKRALTSQLLTLTARFWFPRLLKNVSDPLTGLFLVRRDAVDVDRLSPDGFKILLEILVRCPSVRVSELLFDFGPRHDGESKADFREGVRFFRHLLRLRLTANRAFPRFISLALGSWLLDTLLFSGAAALDVAPWWLVALLGAELIILLRFYLTRAWVLGGARAVPGWPSARRFWFTNQLSLLAVRLPLLALLYRQLGWPAGLAVAAAILVEGGIRYALSEQWVFSRRGITMWAGVTHRYDIHGLLRLESQIALPELTYFATAEPLPHVDLQIRVDRHGTPTPQPGALTFSELGRFGFGVAIMPGAAFTEIVLSPAFGSAPYALYKSVLEPVLRWQFARQGVALVAAAAIARDGQGTLLAPAGAEDKTRLTLAAVADGRFRFMADDFVLLTAAGELLAFPKPITITPPLLRTPSPLASGQRLRLRLQTLFYSAAGRNLGLRLAGRRLPMATLNLYLEAIWRRPKRPATDLVPHLQFANRAQLDTVVLLKAGTGAPETVAPAAAQATLAARQRAARGFFPYGPIAHSLPPVDGQPWLAVEGELIAAALRRTGMLLLVDDRPRWWAALTVPEQSRSGVARGG